MLKVLTTKETLDILIDKFDEEKMAFVKFGDGEIMMMDGWDGREGNHYNSERLQDELNESFQIDDSNYLISIGCGYEKEPNMSHGAFEPFKNDKNLCSAVEALTNKREFLNVNAIHYSLCNRPEEIVNLFAMIREEKPLLVGGEHLREASKFLNADFFPIPESQAFYQIDDWYPKLVKMPHNTILISAGICGNIIAKRLWFDREVGKFIEMGAVLDGLLQLKTRAWIPLMAKEIQSFLNIFGERYGQANYIRSE